MHDEEAINRTSGVHAMKVDRRHLRRRTVIRGFQWATEKIYSPDACEAFDYPIRLTGSH